MSARPRPHGWSTAVGAVDELVDQGHIDPGVAEVLRERVAERLDGGSPPISSTSSSTSTTVTRAP